MIKLLKLLKELGPDLRRPYADTLREGIRELRVVFGGDSFRLLYFFFMGDRIVVTHAFTKKTARVPDVEIERSLRCRRQDSTGGR